MNLKIISSLIFFTLLSISPFTFSETTENVTSTTVQQSQSKNNGEVIAWISAIDSFEISASDIADNKNIDADVKDYATMLNSDHSKNLKQVLELSSQLNDKPVETKDLLNFKQSGKADLVKLKKADKNFQKVFIDAMVSGHTGALQKVDNDLMKKVNNDTLKNFLQETRDMIAHHLEVAKAIQQKMQTA